ncbi:MAG: PD40 domain-containing protein [Chromatiales bacterium]|nr:PD40 domain-containing protein [Chromatiales bacterium]
MSKYQSAKLNNGAVLVAGLLSVLLWSSDSLLAADAPAADPRELPYFMVPIGPDAAEAYWAPDSRHLIAQTRDPRAIKTLTGGDGALTYIFSDDGKDIWAVNDRGQDACSFFFPDGKRIVWTSTRDNMDMPVGNWSDSDNYPQGGELYVSDWHGKNIRRMTNNKYYEAEVSVSPDGKWLAFGRQIDGNMDIWVMNVDTGKEFQVTRTDDWQEGAPFFMPDNEHIIFRAWKRSEYKKIKPTPMTIFTIRKDGTEWRRHTYDTGMNWHPTPAPDGHHYVYVKALTPSNWEIYLGDLAGGEPRRLTYYDKLDMLAHISPDGKKMNWGRAVGEGFMSNIRTHVMDVSSLDLGKENYVPFDPTWGEAMPASAP